MEDKLNMSKRRLIEDLKHRIEEKKLLRNTQQALITASQCLVPVFTKLRELTINAETVLVETELGNRFLDNTIKNLEGLNEAEDIDKASAIMVEGKELFANTQQATKKEDEQIEYIREQYKNMFEDFKSVFDSEYTKINEAKLAQQKLHDQLGEENHKKELEDEFMEEIKATTTALISKDKSNFTSNSRDICYNKEC